MMFVAAFFLALISHWHVMHIQVEPRPISRPKRQAIRPGIGPMRSPVFRIVAFIAVIIHLAFFTILPVVPLHLVENLGATESFMALFGIAELTAAALICLFTERIATMIGTRRMIGLAMVGTALAAMNLAMTPSLGLALLGGALSGGSWAMATIGLLSYFTETTRDLSDEEMTRYSTVYHQVIYLAAFIGPLLGSGLANSGVDLVLVILFGAGLRLVSGIIIYQIGAARAASPLHMLRVRATRRY
jgi:MFS family permease